MSVHDRNDGVKRSVAWLAARQSSLTHNVLAASDDVAMIHEGRVIPLTAINRVAHAVDGIDRVAAGPAQQPIVAATTDNAISASTSTQAIIALPAGDLVGAVSAGDIVVAVAAVERVVTSEPVDVVDAGISFGCVVAKSA